MISKKKRSGRNGRGSVLLIASLLIGSAFIRIGAGAGQAVATENPMTSPIEAPEEPHRSSNATAMSEADRGNMSKMLKSFQEREALIAKREDQIAVRMKALRVADEQIEKRLSVLEEAENSLRGLLALANTAAEDDLARLTTVYENMKSKDAAPLFEQMEPAFAAGFLGRMKPNSAAGIMAGLSPEAAYSISVILAGRNADVPKG